MDPSEPTTYILVFGERMPDHIGLCDVVNAGFYSSYEKARIEFLAALNNMRRTYAPAISYMEYLKKGVAHIPEIVAGRDYSIDIIFGYLMGYPGTYFRCETTTDTKIRTLSIECQDY